MTPGKFLRLVWPSTGLYCIAHPFTPPGSAITVYAHKVFKTISEAVTHVHEMQHVSDTYFAVLSLAQERVWDPDKTDAKTGQKGAWAIRKQQNMLASRASFFDLDVGADAAKYPTQRDALAGLIDFISITALPMPTLVSSGGGVHVYWHYDQEMPADEWKVLALHMRQLAEHLKLKVDPMRTTDITSVLRVPGTFNWKDRSNPREVKVLQEGVVTPLETFKRIVSDAMIKHGVEPQMPTATAARPIATAAGLGTQSFNDFGPPPSLSEVATACAQVQEILRSHGDPKHAHYGQLDNTAWYRGMLATISHVEDGDSWCRKLTDLHPRTNADIDAKLLQLKQFGPARCETLAQFMPWKDGPCQKCRFRNDPSVPNPLAATRKAIVAPPPSAAPITPPAQPAPPPPPPLMQIMAPAPAVQAAMIPNPPKPYERLKAGGIAITRTDKDGNSSTSVIYAHDLYPLKRMVNSEAAHEQQVWRVTLPRTGARDFVIDADVLYDSRKFCAVMAHNGIYPNKADISTLQDYMVAYISQLQRDLDADNQIGHLGWTANYQQFVLPDKVLQDDGSVRNSALTEGAKRATQFVTKRGDMAQQIQLLGFYNQPVYTPNQFAILNSFASIILYATGHHGVVVNMSGESGASKSTTLYTAASVWGAPKLLPINGTQRGATANARSQRIAVNGNLPTMVDEITHLPVKDAIDLAMSVSQPGHRLRLNTDGVEKAGTGSDGYKSAIMLATANSSLHALLATDNAAGTAGSMRVFEMRFAAQRAHTKAEADDFLRQLEQHYGHLGEVFLHFVVRNRAAVEHRVHTVMREIDIEANVQSSERYWSAVIAANIVAGEICHALRLTPYDVGAIRTWATKIQIPYMRGVVREEYRDPLALLSDYIAEKSGNIVVVERTTSIGANTAGQHVASDTAYAQIKPNGALLGHYDVRAGVLYLLKQGFKEHCQRVGASATRILDELAQPRLLPDRTPRRIIVEKQVRRTLGAGTDLAKGQTWCFAVDMTHPDVSGVSPTLAATGGAPTSAPAGQLRSVK